MSLESMQNQTRIANHAAVDELLRDIGSWRERLAKSIVSRNPAITASELNESVGLILDRFVFLRLAEDRGIEPFGQLRSLAQGQEIHRGFLDSLCPRIYQKYRSSLFDLKKDRLTPGLALDDPSVRELLSELYPARPRYDFASLPAEVLGHIYERFLGQLIRLTPDQRAEVEKKPEFRKAGGVFYTPQDIVREIVRETIGPRLRELERLRSPAELVGFRVLDMACGSGSFLLGAYQYLLEHYLSWYLAHDPKSHPRVVEKVGEGWKLKVSERKRILLEHIYGVDIDRQAIEVTKLSLLLAVLEGEPRGNLEKQMRLFEEPLLEELDRNLRSGNSLIAPEDLEELRETDSDEIRRIHPLDWSAEFPEAMAAGGFDCVIGNPPYIRIQTVQDYSPTEAEVYRSKYRCAVSGGFDTYVLFVEKALGLLRGQGSLGFILPHKFFNAKYGQPLRSMIGQRRGLRKVVHFGDRQVFAGATTYTCLLFLERTPQESFEWVRVDDLQAWRSGKPVPSDRIEASRVEGGKEWVFATGARGQLLTQLRSKHPIKLGMVAERISQGIRTSANEVYVLDLRRECEETLIAYSEQLGEEVELERNGLSRFLQGRDIKAYAAPESSKVAIIPYAIHDRATELIPEERLRREQPRIWSYLEENRAYLENREKGRMKAPGWYGFVYPKNIELMRAPKIIVPDIADRPSFLWDESGRYSFASGYGITFKKSLPESPKYWLGLLNSSIVGFFLREISTPMRGGFFRFFAQYLEQIPLRSIDFSDPRERSLHDDLVARVDERLELQRLISSTTDHETRDAAIQQTAAVEHEIDLAVCWLYGLGAEELAIANQAAPTR